VRVKIKDEWLAGDLVSLDVTWPNGRTSSMTGRLIVVVGDEAFVETEVGNVVGPVDSLEHHEGAADENQEAG
jgi:hypothetical protein